MQRNHLHESHLQKAIKKVRQARLTKRVTVHTVKSQTWKEARSPLNFQG